MAGAAPQAATEGDKSYKAFLSYSHAADGKLSPALQSAMQTFAKPWYGLRTMRVFRDETSLSVNAALWPSIEQALSHSEYFILLASPEAARSRWVQQEVSWWLANRPAGRMFIVLTGGELVWDPNVSDFDWSVTTAIPGILRSAFRHEPLYVDLRWAREQDSLSPRHSRFRVSVLDIIAPLLGRPKDELDGEDVRQHRRLRTAGWSAAAALSLLTVVSVFATYRALQNAQAAQQQGRSAEAQRRKALEAADREKLAREREQNAHEETERRRQAEVRAREAEKEQRLQAERRGHISQARYLAAEAMAAPRSYPVLSALLAIESIRATLDRDDITIPAAEQALRELASMIGGRSLPGSPTAANVAIFSPDNRWLAVGTGNTDRESVENAVRLYDLSNPAVPAVLEGPGQPILALRFGDGGRRLIAATRDTRLAEWSITEAGVKTSGRKFPIQEETQWKAVAFSREARWIARGGGPSAGGLHLVEALTGAYSTTPGISEGGLDLVAIVISKDDRLIAALQQNGTVLVWTLTEKAAKPVVFRPRTRCEVLAFSADGAMLAAGGEKGTIYVWDTSSISPNANPLHSLTAREGTVLSLAFSADGHWLAVGGGDAPGLPARDNSIRMLPLQSEDPVRDSVVLAGHERGVIALAFSSDSHWFASAASDGSVRIWPWLGFNPAAEPTILRGHTAPVKGVAVSRDSRVFATFARRPVGVYRPDVRPDETLRLFDLTKRPRPVSRAVITVGGGGPQAPAFSSDGKWLAAGGFDQRYGAWSMEQINSPPLELKGHSGRHVDRAVFSPDGTWLATASVDTAWLSNLRSASISSISQVLRGHRSRILALVFSPDGRWLMTGSEDNTARLWPLDPEKGAANAIVLDGLERFVLSAAFSPDGRWLATGGGEASERDRENDIPLLVWDLRAADPSSTRRVLRGHLGSVVQVAFNPSSRWAATASLDGTARLWDVRRAPGSSVVLRGHGDRVCCVAFTSDGRRLLTAGTDGSVRIWELDEQGVKSEPVTLKQPSPITALSVTPDDQWVISGALDGTARVWRLGLAELISEVCAAAGRNLTDAEWRQYVVIGKPRPTCVMPGAHR